MASIPPTGTAAPDFTPRVTPDQTLSDLRGRPVILSGGSRPASLRAANGDRWSRALRRGSGVSPILANVFLHYVVDLWFTSGEDGGQPGR